MTYAHLEMFINCRTLPLAVGLDIAKIAGLVAVDPLRASNT